MNALQRLNNNKEYWELRAKWQETKDTPFPPFNFDEYLGIEHYLETLRKELCYPEHSGNPDHGSHS